MYVLHASWPSNKEDETIEETIKKDKWDNAKQTKLKT